jgi:hypothetical protein
MAPTTNHHVSWPWANPIRVTIAIAAVTTGTSNGYVRRKPNPAPSTMLRMVRMITGLATVSRKNSLPGCRSSGSQRFGEDSPAEEGAVIHSLRSFAPQGTRPARHSQSLVARGQETVRDDEDSRLKDRHGSGMRCFNADASLGAPIGRRRSGDTTRNKAPPRNHGEWMVAPAVSAHICSKSTQQKGAGPAW